MTEIDFFDIHDQSVFTDILDIAGEAIISLDENYRIFLFNKKAEQVFGYAANEIIGQSLDLLFPQRFRAIHRDHMDVFAQSDTSTRLLSERQDVFGQRKDGSEFPAATSISKLEVEGKQIFTVIIRDITQRKQIEQELIKQEKHLKTLVEDRKMELNNAHAEMKLLNEKLNKENAERKSMGEELHSQIALINGLLDVTTETIEIVDAKTMEYIKWNKTFNRVTGYSDEEIHTMNPVYDFVYEADIPRAEEVIEELLLKGRASASLRQVNKDGSRIPFEYTGGADYDQAGNPRHLIFIGRDITERKEAEEALRQSEERYHALFDAVGDPIWLIDIQDGSIVDYNQVSQQSYGYSPEELSVLKISDFEVKENPEETKERLTQLVNEGSVLFETLHRMKSGEIRSIELNLRHLTLEGKSYSLGVGRDITERKEAEEAYRDLVEKISDVIYAADTNSVITFINPAIETLIGLPPDQVVGKSFAQFVHPDDLGPLQDNFQDLLSGATPDSNEYRILTASGETRWVRISSQRIRDGDQVTGLQGVVTDITERKILQKKLKEAATNAERDRLARELHDTVTQSLYSINLQSDAISMALSSGNQDKAERRLEILKEIAQEAMTEMRLLIYQLHPQVLQEEGLAVAIRQRLNAVEVRSGVVADFQVEGERRLPAKIESTLFQIAKEGLNNILRHAKASEILVRLSFGPNICRLKIQDNGVGFDPESLGLYVGYGLANMRDRLEKIDGALTIDTQPGAGTILDIEVACE